MSHKWREIGSRDDELTRRSTVLQKCVNLNVLWPQGAADVSSFTSWNRILSEAGLWAAKIPPNTMGSFFCSLHVFLRTQSHKQITCTKLCFSSKKSKILQRLQIEDVNFFLNKENSGRKNQICPTLLSVRVKSFLNATGCLFVRPGNEIPEIWSDWLIDWLRQGWNSDHFKRKMKINDWLRRHSNGQALYVSAENPSENADTTRLQVREVGSTKSRLKKQTSERWAKKGTLQDSRSISAILDVWKLKKTHSSVSSSKRKTFEHKKRLNKQSQFDLWQWRV